MRISDWSSDVCSSDQRQQSGADRVNMDQPGAALARRQHGEEGRHDRFEMLRARAGDADDLDPAMFARRLGQIGRAAEHDRAVIGPHALHRRHQFLEMAFDPADVLRKAPKARAAAGGHPGRSAGRYIFPWKTNKPTKSKSTRSLVGKERTRSCEYRVS